MTWLVILSIPGAMFRPWRRVSGVSAHFARLTVAVCMGVAPELLEVSPW